MQIKTKRFLRAFTFIILLLACLIASSYVLAPKGNTAEDGINNPVAHGFLSEPENTLDIFMIGNSDAYSGFSPMELWHAYGYTSYVCGEGRQTPAQSYAMLQDVYLNHSPKLVIMETDNFFAKGKSYKNIAVLLNAKLGSPFSVFMYHNRWKTIKWEDVFKAPNYTAHCIPRGQWVTNEIQGYFGGDYMIKTSKEARITSWNIQSLESFIDLCNENGTVVLLVELPSASSWNYKKHNAVQRFANDHELTFLDLNLETEKFGLIWEKDSRDGGNHLNNDGAKKATLYIGDFISKNFKIPDYRDDPQYQFWNDDYKEFLKMLEIQE